MRPSRCPTSNRTFTGPSFCVLLSRVAPPLVRQRRTYSSSASAEAPTAHRPTGILMMNLGGPSTVHEVEPFLKRLFSDREIIQLPLQPILGPLITAVRAPKVRKLYESIGGGSPIRKWTELQGAAMVKHLDQISPATAPHKYYIAFRYAAPHTEDALDAMKRDGVKRAVAFTQYPQWSCTTTGSSLNELWRQLKKKHMENEFEWSIIDRWHHEPGFLAALEDRLRAVLAKIPEYIRDQAEVAATMHALMQRMKVKNPFMLAYQSGRGWLGPKTDHVLRKLAQQGHRHVVLVPIAFTSDHIETLREIDIDFANVAKEAGITGFYRAESLNDSPVLTTAFAEIVASHLRCDTS